MFAKLDAYECMLKNDSADENQRKLAALLRLWVNMLRSGKLIHTDTTQLIQESLAACGWKDAVLLEQQDTSEAFAFITETLQLPLLALQVDLFHHGKRDADDHKVVHERLLNLGVPPDPDGKGIKLEDCLEEYFNSKVDVLRDSPEEKKGTDKPSVLVPQSTIRVVPEDEVETPRALPEDGQFQRMWTTPGVVESPVSIVKPELPDESPTSSSRTRSTSIIQRIVVDGDGHPADSSESASLLQRAKRTGSTVVKAVTIPAWQFFRLIPWHTTSNAEPTSDAEVARQFNRRPIVGICLKRYTMTEKGIPIRHNTLIDIPDSMRLPHFMVVDEKAKQASNGLSQEYKLVLQSVVCHRGDSLHSGHYIAFARVAPKLLTDNRRHDHDPPPDYEEAQWVKFDDLATEKRVVYVDDIKQSLREEMPYLLFYQIVPMVDVTTASSDGSAGEPPSYVESAISIPGTPSVETVTDHGSRISRPSSSYFGSEAGLVPNRMSIRLSSDAERPARFSLDEDVPYPPIIKTDGGDRRGSVALSEAASPAVNPQDENTGTRLSRAAAKFTKTGTKSRPTSQIGEGRISLTMSRLGFTRQGRDGSAGTGPEVAGDEQQAATAAAVVDTGDGKEKGKEKEQHGLHQHHPLVNNKKDRKSRDKDEKKEKDKEKEKTKAKDSGKDVPDRECLVM
ncbi:hypothetical protein VTK26DRAFT_9346 [Humicola hyalothermophila]